jgi:DNA-binding beta-propeller fold protein YncE
MVAITSPAQDLKLTQTIAIPNVQGGFNHMSVDSAHRRLFATASTNKTLEIIDVATYKPLISLTGEKPAAALYAPEFNQLYVSRGQSVVIYDGTTFAPTAVIDLHSDLDELQYDPQAKELYVGCMSDGSTGIAVIGIPQGKLLAKISLPSKPQGFAVEHAGNRIFANTPVQQQVAVIDRRKRVTLPPLVLHDLQGNTPIALDEVHHRLFLGVRHPSEFVVLDTESGRQVAAFAINSDMDDLFYDAQSRRIYISCGEGFVDVIQQLTADQYQLIGRIATIPGARTSVYSPILRQLFVGVPQRRSEPAEILVFQTEK